MTKMTVYQKEELSVEPGDPPFTYCNWVEARGFRTWLESKGIRYSDLSTAHRRRFSAAHSEVERANYVTYDVVDSICIEFGHHVSELPDDIWAEKRTTGNWKGFKGNTTQATRDAAVQRVLSGEETKVAVANDVGVSSRTLGRWIKGHR